MRPGLSGGRFFAGSVHRCRRGWLQLGDGTGITCETQKGFDREGVIGCGADPHRVADWTPALAARSAFDEPSGRTRLSLISSIAERGRRLPRRSHAQRLQIPCGERESALAVQHVASVVDCRLFVLKLPTTCATSGRSPVP